MNYLLLSPLMTANTVKQEIWITVLLISVQLCIQNNFTVAVIYLHTKHIGHNFQASAELLISSNVQDQTTIWLLENWV